MTYGLGRSLEYMDMPTVRRIVRESAREDYRFSAIILGIVGSDQFRLRGLPAPDTEGLSARQASE
jgi:hypothetical protein